MTEFILGLISGFIAGSSAIIMISILYAKNTIKKTLTSKQELLKDLSKARDVLKKATSVQERMNQVKDLTRDQIDMQMKMELPQKNSLDGKYKNGLSRQIKEIEEEKKSILQSILDDGYDPEISTLNADSKIETMKLSEFMQKEKRPIDTKSKPKLTLVRSPEEESQSDSDSN